MARRLAMALSVVALLGTNSKATAEALGTFGTPGLIDMPTAEVLDDGQIALSTNRFGAQGRNALTFQITPNIYGVFRYGTIRGYDDTGTRDRFDRSFDLHYQFLDETAHRPSVAVGLRDFGGTGILSSEYVVATKHLGNRWEVTGGLGWGRLAQRDPFDNPLAIFGDRFETRPDTGAGGLSTTGQLDFGSWFRGEAAFFGGVEYQATDRLSIQLEYATDMHQKEAERDVIDITSPLNIGLSYDYPGGSQLHAFVIGRTTLGIQYSYTFNPAERLVPGGLEEAPLPIPPSNAAMLASWDMDEPATQSRARGALSTMLDQEGINLDGLSTSNGTATIRIQNRRFDVEAQAIGRTARIMANVLPAEVETFEIILQPFGVPHSTVTLQRADLEELQNDLDGAWHSLARSQFADASLNKPPHDGNANVFQRFHYELSPYTAFSLFDPDQPVRLDVGPQLTVSYQPMSGLSFEGVFRYPFYSSIDDATRRSNSGLQRVRSDAVLYAIKSDLEINRLTAEYMFRPGPNLFGRVTAGYLEDMYAGISGEVLWYPIDSNVALGAELNYALQRDFDMLLGLQDYDVVTGHFSAYYDFGNGFLGQVDAGRYLAGDWGATFSVDREFNNGFKIGAYFTLTDIPFEAFGEGSFDKGIRLEVPLSWLTGQPSRDVLTQTIQPVLRDGGARLNVANRLYDVTRDYRRDALANGWGRMFR